MKLVFVAVSLIVVLTVDCRSSQPEPDPQHLDITEYPDWPESDSQQLDIDEDPQHLEDPEWPGFTPEILFPKTTSDETTSVTSQPDGIDPEEVSGESESESRASGCKPNDFCKFYGGYCVTSSSQCLGNLRPLGCYGGSNCQCCIPGCPTHLPGCFYMGDVNQCFCLSRVVARNFTQQQAFCNSKTAFGKNFVLAHPLDVLSLRSYLVQEYGYLDYPFVNARGTGSLQKWQDNTGYIYQYSTFYYLTYRNSTSYCPIMLTYSFWLKSYPAQPYYFTSCSSRIRTTLCELPL